jgi:hypothetical protein
MNKCCIAVGAIVLAAYLAQSSGASVAATPSGDTCTATGSGTSYTLSVTLGANSPAQSGFAIGTSARHVTNIEGSGQMGQFGTSSVPPGTTGELILGTAAVPGESTSLAVTTSGAVKDHFTLVPQSSSPGTVFAAISCPLEQTSVPKSNFTVNPHPVYSAAAKRWHLVVAIPGAGMVSAQQPEPTVGTAGSASVTAPALVVTKRAGLKTAGKVTLILRTTPKGEARLASTGALTLKLAVTYDPTGGKSATKMLQLTLRK